jgi:hypothetical protein
VPHHFLHVSVRQSLVRAFDTPVDLAYGRVNCFPTAVVAEVQAPKLHVFDPDPQFLPHMSLAYVKRPAPPDELRRVLEPLRDTPLGMQDVEELLRVHVKLSREGGLEPWSVVDRVGR